MKKYGSVCLLILRASLYKILGVMLGTGAVQVLLLFLAMRREAAGGAGLEALVEKSGIAWVFAAACILTVVFLCRMGCAYGAKTGYTLARLSVSEKSVFFCQSAANAVCLLLVWFMQACLAFFLCSAACMHLELAGGQNVLLAFYRSSFLHSLFPLAELSLWIRNIVLALALGFGAAAFSWHQRRGKPGVGVGVVMLISLFFFCQKTGSVYADVPVILLLLVCIAAVLMNVLGGETEDAKT